MPSSGLKLCSSYLSQCLLIAGGKYRIVRSCAFGASLFLLLFLILNLLSLRQMACTSPSGAMNDLEFEQISTEHLINSSPADFHRHEEGSVTRFETVALEKCPNNWRAWINQRKQLENFDMSAWNHISEFSFWNSTNLIQDLIVANTPVAHYMLNRKHPRKPYFSSDACPRYISVETSRFQGLGHRISNWMQGAMLADTFKISHAPENLDESTDWNEHGSYEGMTSFLGLSNSFEYLQSRNVTVQEIDLEPLSDGMLIFT